jgi:hypothetical protein
VLQISQDMIWMQSRLDLQMTNTIGLPDATRSVPHGKELHTIGDCDV